MLKRAHLLFVLPAGLAGYLGVTVLTGRPEPSQTEAGMRENAEIYQANCASCHGVDGSGDTAVGRQLNLPDLASEEVQEKTDAELTEAIGAVAVHSGLGQRLGDRFARAVAHVRTLGEDPGEEPER